MKRKKLTALLISAGMALSAMPLIAAGQPAEDPLFGVLPDWVPTNFADAVQFYNTHGKSYVAGNIICLVRPMKQNEKEDSMISISGSMTMVNTPACTEPKYYALEIPEKPDPSDEEAFKAYQAYCEKLGLPSDDYGFFESYDKSDLFEVGLFRVLDGLDLTVEWQQKDDDESRTLESFSFENKGGTVTETDIYGWLPDSPKEYNTFLDANGRVSVHDTYIAYCDETNFSMEAAMSMEQSGEGKIREAFRSRCAEYELNPVECNDYSSVVVYQPEADGIVNATWTVSKPDETPLYVTRETFEIKDNCKAVSHLSPTRKGTTVFTFVDKNTGKLIDPSEYQYTSLQKFSIGEPCTSEYFILVSNPLTVQSLSAYDPQCWYSFSLETALGRYEAPEFEVTSETADQIEVTCKVRWAPWGDFNGNNEFNIADIVFMEEWLVGDLEMKIDDWRVLDFYRDNQLNALDLSLMKQALIRRLEANYVKPDTPIHYGAYLRVEKDGTKLHQGPGEDYPVIARIPATQRLVEHGYQSGNDEWLYTNYKGQNGWIRIVDNDGNPTVFFEVYADKPVIYLYPEQETDVHVELELTESELSTTYPKYQNGWDVTAYPDGSLLNKADGSHHRYLFWDSKNCRTRYDFSKGFCVAGSDTEQFLKEKLTYMGLTEEEMNEFIVYWLPRMEHNAYNLISFQGEAYTNSAKLHITPEPDSIFRVFMTYVPLENAVEIEPQELESFERKGFTVVEWGGSEIK